MRRAAAGEKLEVGDLIRKQRRSSARNIAQRCLPSLAAGAALEIREAASLGNRLIMVAKAGSIDWRISVCGAGIVTVFALRATGAA